jgi:hypothetical protein
MRSSNSNSRKKRGNKSPSKKRVDVPASQQPQQEQQQEQPATKRPVSTLCINKWTTGAPSFLNLNQNSATKCQTT